MFFEFYVILFAFGLILALIVVLLVIILYNIRHCYRNPDKPESA